MTMAPEESNSPRQPTSDEGATGSNSPRGDPPPTQSSPRPGGGDSPGNDGAAADAQLAVSNAGDRPAQPQPGQDDLAIAVPAQQPAGAPESNATGWQLAMQRAQALVANGPTLPSVPVPESVKKLPEVNCQEQVLRVIKAFPHFYAEKLVRFHWAFLLFWSVVVIISISAAWRTVEVSTDLDRFHQVDGPASMNYSVYAEASKFMREVRDPLSLADRETFQIELYYEAKSGSILDEAPLRDIRSFEQQLLNLPGWQSLCNSGDTRARFRCQPGESLGNYIWPRRLDNFLNEDGIFRLDFDGTATERLPVTAVLAYLSEGAADPHDLSKFLPRGTYNPESASSTVMRSLFTFTASSLNSHSYREAYSDFVDKELYPALVEAAEKAKDDPDPDSWDEPSYIRIYFSGKEIDAHEIVTALEDDVRNAAGALVFSFFIAWLRLKSAFLAFFGTLLLCLAVLQAYVMTPAVQEVSIASFLSVFLAFGFCGNLMFFIQDVWQRSLQLPGTGSDGRVPAMARRVVAVHKTAILQLMPAFITGLCFFSLLLSLLRPMREFGLFMGVLLMVSLILSVAVFVPLLLLHEQWVRPVICEKCPHVLAFILEPVQIPWTKASKFLAEKCIRLADSGKKVILVTAVIWGIAFILAAAFAATSDGDGLPEVFPPSHHRNAGRPLAASFATAAPADEPAPANSTFCEPGRATESDCGLHWCEAPLAPPQAAVSAVSANSSGSCSCYKTNSAGALPCGTVQVSASFSGSAAATLTENDRFRSLREFIMAEWPSTTSVVDSAGSSSRRRRSMQRSLVLEHWESGATNLEPYIRLPVVEAVQSGLSTRTCPEEVVCHCGTRVCQKPNSASFLPNARALDLLFERRLAQDEDAPTSDSDRHSPSEAEVAMAQLAGSRAEGRRLQSTGSPVTGPMEVTIVFGLTPPTDSPFFDATPVWSLDNRFNPSSPDAQRAMRAICQNLPADFRIQSTSCWIDDFRMWLMDRGLRFPVERFGDFQAELKEFLRLYPQNTQYMWLNRDGNMTATALRVTVGAAHDIWQVVEDIKRWERYIDHMNRQAPTVASRAWATSRSWADAEAYDEALASSWRVCLLCLLGVFLAGLLYTMDLEMMFLITMVCILDSTIVSFFMYCLFQWAFGPWELVIMTVFLCFSVEPAFRIGREFVFPAKPAGAAQPSGSGAGEGAEQLALEPAPQDDMADEVPERWGRDDASDGKPDGPSPAECLQRSVYTLIGSVLMISVKLLLCGILMAACQFRLFTRMGCVAIIGSLLWAPSTLLVFPAAILVSKRTRREPDLFVIWRYAKEKATASWA